MSEKPPATRATYHHGDLRRTLLAGARELIQREGHERLSLRGVARQIGVSRMAPYRHFADKQALLAAIVEEGFLLFGEAMRRAADAHEDPVDRLRSLASEYVTFAAEHSGHFRLMFSPRVVDPRDHPAVFRAAQNASQPLLEAVEACKRVGFTRDAPAAEMALAVWTMLHGLTNLAPEGTLDVLGQGPKPLAMVIPVIVDYALAAIRAQAR